MSEVPMYACVYSFSDTLRCIRSSAGSKSHSRRPAGWRFLISEVTLYISHPMFGKKFLQKAN